MPSLVEQYIRAALPSPHAPFQDPLGRKEGESLDERRFTSEQLKKKRLNVGERAFSAVWQQDPVTEGGNLLHRSAFQQPGNSKILSVSDFAKRTQSLLWCRAYDFAYTAVQINKSDPDYTVGAKMAFDMDKWGTRFDIYLWEIVRYRKGWNDVKSAVADQAAIDGKECYIGGEANGPQSAAIQDLRGLPELSQFIIWGLSLMSESVAKAQLWTSRAADGLMYLCDDSWLPREARWHNTFFDEIEVFPNGSHDDIVSSISVGYPMCMTRVLGNQKSTVSQSEDIGGRTW